MSNTLEQKSPGQCLCELFNDLTQQGRAMVPWGELPPLFRDAWQQMYHASVKMHMADEEYRSNDQPSASASDSVAGGDVIAKVLSELVDNLPAAHQSTVLDAMKKVIVALEK